MGEVVFFRDDIDSIITDRPVFIAKARKGHGYEGSVEGIRRGNYGQKH